MIRRASPPILAGLILAFTLSCGGGGSSPSTPSTPVPTPAPTPTPAPAPTPTPTSNPDCVSGGDCPNNTTPVVKAVLRLYKLFDNAGGWVLPTPDPTKGHFVEKFPVGFTIVLDVTGRDAENKETQGVKGDGSGIEWFFLVNHQPDDSMVQFAGDPAGPFQHKYLLVKPGTFEVYVGFDGVGSGSLFFEVVPCTPPDYGCRS
jgi:hypothetical protein